MYDSWKAVLEDLRQGYIAEFEARENLDELSYDMTEEQLEQAEEELEDCLRTLEDSMPLEMFLDSIPEGEEDDYYGRTPNREADIWGATPDDDY